MRKVIFEQVINTLIAILLTIGACQTVLISNYTPKPGHSFAGPDIGWGMYLFMTVTFLAVFVRNYYAKKLGAKDGYNQDDGEFSSQDEREVLISGKASKISYSVGATFMMVVCFASMFINTFLTGNISLTIAYIIATGTGAVVTYLTYLFAWIHYDNKD